MSMLLIFNLKISNLLLVEILFFLLVMMKNNNLIKLLLMIELMTLNSLVICSYMIMKLNFIMMVCIIIFMVVEASVGVSLLISNSRINTSSSFLI